MAKQSRCPPPSRRARAEQLRRERERRSLRNRMVVAALVLVGVGALLFVRLRDGDGGDGGAAPTVASTSCTQDTKYDGEGRNHVPSPTYEVNPPAGGDHTPDAAPPGYYRDGDRIPSDGQLVHAMEHGFIVLWYRPGLDAASTQKIEALSDRFGRTLIVVPRRSLGGPVAATAWHHRLLCSAIDADAIAAFAEAYADKGPEKGFM